MELSLSDRMMTGAREQYVNQWFCDYTIHTSDGELFKVHRCYLAAVSDYFKAMLTGDMLESRSDKIVLKNVSSAAMRCVLDVIYHKCNLNLTEEIVVEVLNAGSLLQIQEIINKCADFVKLHINEENVTEVLKIAKMYSLCELKQAVGDFIVERLPGNAQGDTFPNLHEIEGEDLELYLTKLDDSEKLNAKQLFELARRWVSDDLDQRTQHFETLLGSFRLPLLNPQEIQDLLESPLGFIKEKPFGKVWIEEMQIYNSRSLMERVTGKLAPSHWKETNTVPSLVVLGRTDADGPVDRMLHLVDQCPDSCAWYELPFKTEPFAGQIFVTAVNNFMFLVEYGETNAGRCFLFDPRLSQWEPYEPIPEGFWVHKLIACKKSVFALAGNAGEAAVWTILVNTFEQYTWKTICMPLHLENIDACALGDYVYFAGKCKGGLRARDNQYLFYRFHAVTGKLETLPSIPRRHKLSFRLLPGLNRIFVIPSTKNQVEEHFCMSIFHTEQKMWMSWSQFNKYFLLEGKPKSSEDIVQCNGYCYFISTCMPPGAGARQAVKCHWIASDQKQLTKLCDIPDGVCDTNACVLFLPDKDRQPYLTPLVSNKHAFVYNVSQHKTQI